MTLYCATGDFELLGRVLGGSQQQLGHGERQLFRGEYSKKLTIAHTLKCDEQTIAIEKAVGAGRVRIFIYSSM